MKRLQSEMEARGTSLIKAFVSLKLRSSVPEEQPGANDSSLTITRVFSIQIKRRGFEMRLVLQGKRAPAPLADLALIKAIARGRLWDTIC